MRKKTDILSWLMKLIVGTVFVSVLSIATTGIIVNAYITNILQEYHLLPQGQSLSLSGMLHFGSSGKQEGSADAATQDSSVSNADAPPADTANTNTAPSADRAAVSSGDAAGSDTGAAGTATVPPEQGMEPQAVPAWSDVSGQQSNRQSDQNNQASQKTQNNGKQTANVISAEDRLHIYSLLSSVLSEKEVQNISGLLESGMTSEQIQQIEKDAEAKLSEGNYQTLLNIFNKYTAK